MVRREGWLELDTGKAKSKVYALVEGYVLSLSRSDEAGGCPVILV